MSKHHIQPEYRKESGWRGTEGLTCLARRNVHAPTPETGENMFSIQLAPSRIDNRTRSIHTLLDVMATPIDSHITDDLRLIEYTETVRPQTEYWAFLVLCGPSV